MSSKQIIFTVVILAVFIGVFLYFRKSIPSVGSVVVNQSQETGTPINKDIVTKYGVDWLKVTDYSQFNKGDQLMSYDSNGMLRGSSNVFNKTGANQIPYNSIAKDVYIGGFLSVTQTPGEGVVINTNSPSGLAYNFKGVCYKLVKQNTGSKTVSGLGSANRVGTPIQGTQHI